MRSWWRKSTRNDTNVQSDFQLRLFLMSPWCHWSTGTVKRAVMMINQPFEQLQRGNMTFSSVLYRTRPAPGAVLPLMERRKREHEAGILYHQDALKGATTTDVIWDTTRDTRTHLRWKCGDIRQCLFGQSVISPTIELSFTVMPTENNFWAYLLLTFIVLHMTARSLTYIWRLPGSITKKRKKDYHRRRRLRQRIENEDD